MNSLQNDESPSGARINQALVMAAIFAVLLAMVVAFGKSRGNLPYAIGAATGQFVVIAMITGLFSIFKRFRKPPARAKVILWTAVFVLLVSFATPGA